jgi:hypothetical protein
VRRGERGKERWSQRVICALAFEKLGSDGRPDRRCALEGRCGHHACAVQGPLQDREQSSAEQRRAAQTQVPVPVQMRTRMQMQMQMQMQCSSPRHPGNELPKSPRSTSTNTHSAPQLSCTAPATGASVQVQTEAWVRLHSGAGRLGWNFKAGEG